MMTFNSINLYWNTLRYLKPVQIYGRILRLIYRPKFISGESPPLRSLAKAPARWAECSTTLTGPDSFRFLNDDGSLKDGWNPATKSMLWRYNLHYFDDLNATDAGNRKSWHCSLIDRWIDENPPGYSIGWEPYPLSLRIVNWIKWFLAGNEPETEWLNALAVQIRYLSKRLEYHLLGNHMFANLKALVFAGCFFQGREAEKWLSTGLIGLAAEQHEQILADGGHFERSPMYHSIILEDILDLINVIAAYQPDLSGRNSKVVDEFLKTAKKMLQWLHSMTHPDGEVALLNDAAFHIASDLKSLVSYGQRLSIKAPSLPPRPLVHFRSTGYIRVASSPFTAFLDVAPLGPDFLPAHGHADTLSFELSCESCRVIVDSGTSCYGISEERLRQRSTAAHNTIEIDGKNSSEIWSGFRVAKRAYPRKLSVKKRDGVTEIGCSHDGYRWLPGKPVHNRKWRFNGQKFVVYDIIGGNFSSAISRFHFHPNVRVQCTGKSEGRIDLPDGNRLFWFVTGAAAAIMPSTYHPEFGVRLTNQCLEVILEGKSCEIEFCLSSP